MIQHMRNGVFVMGFGSKPYVQCMYK